MCLKQDRMDRLETQIQKDSKHVIFLYDVRANLDKALKKDWAYDADRNRELITGKMARLRKRIKEDQRKLNILNDSTNF